MMSLRRAVLAQTTIALGLAFLFPISGLGQTAPDSDPILRIKSIFAGAIWRSDVDANEDYVVVSNSDDALNTWALDLPAVGTNSRVSILNEQRKRAHAVAMSPSAELVAYSTPPLLVERGLSYQPSSSRIYILRRASGEIVRVLDGPSNDITTRPQAIRFSPDGEHLAAVLSSGCGLRVWSTRDWRLIGSYDNSYGGVPGQDRCCRTDNIEECDPLPNGNSLLFYSLGTSMSLIVTSSDSGIHTFSLVGDELTLRVFAPPQALDLDRPAGISISPSGEYLVVGNRPGNRPAPQARFRFRVALIDRDTLKPIRPPMEIRESALKSAAFLDATNAQVSDLAQFSLDRVALLRDDSTDYIFAGTLPCRIAAKIPDELTSRFTVTDQHVCLIRWTVGQSDRNAEFIPIGGTNRVAEVLPLNQRRGILVASQEVITVLAADGLPLASGRRAFKETNSAADFRGSPPNFEFAVSRDARAIRFTDFGNGPTADQGTDAQKTVQQATHPTLSVAFNLLKVPHPISEDLEVPVFKPDQDPNVVQDWSNSKLPLINSQPLSPAEISEDEIFRSVAVLQSRKLVLLGSSEYLRLVSYADGPPSVLCRLPIRDEAYRVNFSADGLLAVTAHSDGTVRWHRIAHNDKTCVFQTLLTVRFSKTKDSQTKDRKWTWVAWLPNGLHAQDFEARDGLEWQSLTPTGMVALTPFERLQGWYSPDAIKGALDLPDPDAHPKKTELPDRDHVLARASPSSSIEVLPNPPSVNANTENVPLGLRINDDRGWPKRLSIKVNGTPVPIAWNGKKYSPTEPLIISRTDLLRDGRLELELLLPTNLRTVHRNLQIYFYVNNSPDAQHVMEWTGELAKPQQRRLWGVFVGLSRYADPSINLLFAENDVIDLARIFVNDFENKATKQTIESDRYQEIHLNLAVAGSPSAEAELAQIASRPYVKRFEPTRAGILEAIEDIVAMRSAHNDEEKDDLFLFYFSGHGMISPIETDQGRTLLSTRDTRVDTGSAQLENTTIRSTELLDLFERIPGRKLIIFDACRSLLRHAGQAAFDPTLVASDLKEHAVSADILFSSDAGQFSREVRGLAFDRSRPTSRQGNGLFSYALLQALTTDATLLGNVRNSVVEVRVSGIQHYFNSVFFNTKIPNSEAARLMKKYTWRQIQSPKFYLTRDGDNDLLVRSFVKAIRAQ
jgi:caspase domain-containing protein